MLTRSLIGASVVGAITLCTIVGCASMQQSAGTRPPPSEASKTTPLEEPFRSTLARWNYYRASVSVPVLEVDPALNDAALHHAKYLVNNHIDAGDGIIRQGRLIETGWNTSAHSESVGNPWYTEDGEKWANYANVFRGSAPVSDGTTLVDEQASRTDLLAITDPQLASVGFGLFCEKDDCAGVIVYKHGLPKSQFLALYEGNGMDWNPMLGTMPFTVARLRKPIEFPPASIAFPSHTYHGGEYPDPLTSCPGYSAPTGNVIVLQLGAPTEGEDVKISSSSISEGGSQLESCAFDATSYANPDGSQQKRARQILHQYGAVVVIPKSPLQSGHTYTVSMVADAQPYTWSFNVAPDAKLVTASSR
jgi:hypothetical protein